MEEQNIDKMPSETPETEPSPAPAPAPKKNKFVGMLDGYFGITKAGSSIKTEILAGLTTFMTMVYILLVNAGMFANIPGVSFGAMYITTALAAIVGTLLMAFLAKLPFAQAPGMGLNAFFVFTVVAVFGGGYADFGFTYANALVIVLVSGILFLCLTFGGVREKIVRAVPQCVKVAIPAGIGLFIAFIGLQNAGLVVANGSTLVQIVSLNVLNQSFAQLVPYIVTMLTFIAIAVLSKLKVKGAILWGILGGAVLFYILAVGVKDTPVTIGTATYAGLLGKGSSYYIDVTLQDPFQAFKDFGTQTVGKVFTEGFTGLFSVDGAFSFGKLLNFIAIFISFAMVDMFDTIGTLLGTATRANMLDENGEVPNMRKALLCDSIATCTGAILGTSTVTTFVESSAGVAEGGRTGLTSLMVALLFFVAMFLSPIAQLIPGCATAAALVYVGVLMMACVTNVDWHDPACAVPAFLTVAMMAFTYNISYGIGLGFISYTLIKLCTGKIRRKKDENGNIVEEGIHPITAVLSVLFLLNFMLVSH